MLNYTIKTFKYRVFPKFIQWIGQSTLSKWKGGVVQAEYHVLRYIGVIACRGARHIMDVGWWATMS